MRGKTDAMDLSPAERLLARVIVAAILPVFASAFVGCDEDSFLSPSEPSRNACLDRAVFGDPEASLFVLPYPVGTSYRVLQSYCEANGSHRNQLAYDFQIPVGDEIVAAAAGIVRRIREDWPDDGVASQEHNYVLIEHPDGTVAFYAHLQQNGVDVEVGDDVLQGERIGASGTSATPIPVLHFGVYRSWPPREGHDLAVNFSNAEGELDERGGLQAGHRYAALPY